MSVFEPAELAAAVVEAINSQDADRLGQVVDEGSRVITGRTTHTGAEAITAWSGKRYDHLVKRYAIDEYRPSGGSVLALGSVQYAWIEGGEVADSSPIAFTIDFAGDRLRTLRVHDDTAAALAAFER